MAKYRFSLSLSFFQVVPFGSCTVVIFSLEDRNRLCSKGYSYFRAEYTRFIDLDDIRANLISQGLKETFKPPMKSPWLSLHSGFPGDFQQVNTATRRGNKKAFILLYITLTIIEMLQHPAVVVVFLLTMIGNRDHISYTY